jgi:hypothetical protein
MLQQNIAPSLRQSMINEALDYHQNINSVVFKRQARNLETYARESGKTDPSPKDVLVEGTIRQKVGEISTQIQRLNQQLNYASSGAPAPTVGSGGRRGRVSKANRAARRAATGTELVPYTPPQKEYNRRRDEEHARLDALEYTPPPNYPDEGFYEPGEGPERVDMFAPPTSYNPSGNPHALALIKKYLPRPTRPFEDPYNPKQTGISYDYEPFGEFELPQTSIVPMRSNLGLPQEQRIQTRQVPIQPSDDPSDPDSDPEVEEGESKSQAGESGSVGPPSTATDIGEELERRGEIPHPRDIRFIDEPTAPGTRFSSSPNAADSSRLNIIVDNSLAAIVGGYNTLIDYIDLQQKQRAFTQQDEQLVSQLLRELIEPLKMLIANSAVARQSANKSLVDYTRIYNVISALINRITSSPPFLKVPSGILTEKLPIREDIIQAANYNPDKQANHEYLESLITTIRKEFDLVIRTFPKSPIEKEARELKLKELQTAYDKVIKAGYRPSDEVYQDIKTYQQDKQKYPGISQELKDSRAYLQEKEEELSGITKDEEDLLYAENYQRDNLFRIRERISEDEDKLAKNLEYYDETNKLLNDLAFEYDLATPEDQKKIYELMVIHEHSLSEIRKDVEDISEGLREVDTYHRKIAQNIQDLVRELESRRYSPEYKEALKEIIDSEKEALKDIREESINLLASTYKFEKKFPKSEVIKQTKTYHKGKRVEDRSEANKRRMLNESVKQKYKGNFPTFMGDGMPKASSDGKKTGGHVHKKSADPFGDNSELAPYLTKYLRPSKYRQEVPEVISSSEESSGEEDGKPIREKVGLGKKKRVKAIEDFEIIVSAPKADQGFLLEKKKPKRTGGKKKVSKPVHETSPIQDLWFM